MSLAFDSEPDYAFLHRQLEPHSTATTMPYEWEKPAVPGARSRPGFFKGPLLGSL